MVEGKVAGTGGPDHNSSLPSRNCPVLTSLLGGGVWGGGWVGWNAEPNPAEPGLQDLERGEGRGSSIVLTPKTPSKINTCAAGTELPLRLSLHSFILFFFF